MSNVLKTPRDLLPDNMMMQAHIEEPAPQDDSAAAIAVSCCGQSRHEVCEVSAQAVCVTPHSNEQFFWAQLARCNGIVFGSSQLVSVKRWPWRFRRNCRSTCQKHLKFKRSEWNAENHPPKSRARTSAKLLPCCSRS